MKKSVTLLLKILTDTPNCQMNLIVNLKRNFSTMRGVHILGAIFVAAIWGTNFPMVKLAYTAFTPFSLLVVRFCITLFPLLFFVPKPKNSWWEISLFAVFFWMGQFTLIFLAIYRGLSPGLSALIMQTQVVFTAALSYFIFGTRLKLFNLLGLGVSFAGVVMIALQVQGEGDLLSFFLVVLGALSASIGAIFLKLHKHQEMLPLMVWGSLVPPIPMLLLALMIEGPEAFTEAYFCLTLPCVGAVLYTAYLSTLVATTVFAVLVRIYQPSMISPFLLLVPVFGMASSALILGETFTLQNLCASAIVIMGLVMNQFSGSIRHPFRKKTVTPS